MSEIKKLSAAAFANIGDYAEWNSDGLRLKDTSRMTPEQRAACVITRTETEDDGETINVSISGAEEALATLRQI